MDPLSIIAGVAGIATAGVSLVEVLFDTIDSYQNAPKDIVSIARGVQDLSIILDQLKQVLIDGRNMHTRWLLKSVASAIRQIEYVHAEVWELIPRSGSGFERVKWTFRKGKVRDLLNKIETQKSTVQLVCTTLLLAIQQKKVTKHSRRRPGNDSEKYARSRLRRQAENLVKTAHESLLDLTQNSHQEEIEGSSPTDTDYSRRQQEPQTPLIDGSPTTPTIRVSGPEQDFPDDNEDLSPQKTPDETALWVYDMVFSPTAERKAHEGDVRPRPDESNALIIRNSQGTDIVLASKRPMAAEVVDDLLYDWTHLSWHDIKETSETVRVEPPEQPRRYSDERLRDEQGSNLEPPHQSRRKTRRHRGASEEHIRRGIRVEYESEGSSGGSARSEHWSYIDSQPSDSQRETARRRYSAHDSEREPPTPPSGHRTRSYSDAGPEPRRNPRHATVEDDPDDSMDDPARKRARARAAHEEARRRADAEFEKHRSHTQQPSRSNTNRSRDREADDGQGHREDHSSRANQSQTPSRIQRAAAASLLAGATEAFRVYKEPGGWDSKKSTRVLAAAAGAAAVPRVPDQND
ncbi:hypothetical protein B0J15DRAFT_495041 [Fusarium solani]|uniref:Azaphilone pigments biosynthesis cluster protein L N-terminal domain-containing protein n=1 Tax=Fusarium solani TaxID=169388 RepID=A0A9P9HDC2_FUSSL|nr:uncharacterized protein B0J15DRAFT_495041 [Fusarium solani]KAH7254987.1 hypothetical protein B0J15DRAFT_495041 [Fusarium solani]